MKTVNKHSFSVCESFQLWSSDVFVPAKSEVEVLLSQNKRFLFPNEEPVSNLTVNVSALTYEAQPSCLKACRFFQSHWSGLFITLLVVCWQTAITGHVDNQMWTAFFSHVWFPAFVPFALALTCLCVFSSALIQTIVSDTIVVSCAACWSFVFGPKLNKVVIAQGSGVNFNFNFNFSSSPEALNTL